MYKIDSHKFGDRLKDAIKESGITQKELANKIGVSKTSVNNYANGRIPEVSILYDLSDFLGVTMEWLLAGKSSLQIHEFQKFTEEDKYDLEIFLEFLKLRRTKKKNSASVYVTNNDVLTDVAKEDSILYLPILGQAAAGNPIEIIEVYQGDVKINGKYDRSNSFIIRARGDSMIDAEIKDGDLVIFKTQPAVENGEIALINVNGEATIKYFYLHNGECELRSANPAYPPMKYSTGDISILGKFVEVLEHK